MPFTIYSVFGLFAPYYWLLNKDFEDFIYYFLLLIELYDWLFINYNVYRDDLNNKGDNGGQGIILYRGCNWEDFLIIGFVFI